VLWFILFGSAGERWNSKDFELFSAKRELQSIPVIGRCVAAIIAAISSRSGLNPIRREERYLEFIACDSMVLEKGWRGNLMGRMGAGFRTENTGRLLRRDVAERSI
jgi:hypothetical protein